MRGPHRFFVSAVLALSALSAPAGLAGCATTSPKEALQDASKLVKDRSGQEITWLGEGGEEEARKQASALLSRDLTLPNAVRVSLLGNRHVQVLYDEVGIAQADLVQAGLLKNPTISGDYGVAIDGGGSTFDLGLTSDLLQLLTLSSRKGIARTALAGAKYRVAGEVLHHVYEVKAAFFALQAAQQTFAMRQIVTESAEAAVELARGQHVAGTISDLDLANEESLFAQVTMDQRRSSADLATAREHLNRVMGVWGKDAGWKVTAHLPELPSRDPSLEHLESKAVAARYDLAAAHKDTEVVSYALALAKNTRWTGSVDAGVDFHRETEGVRLLGPTVSVELPIFDQRQASIARIEAQLRQARNREAALAVDIRSEVRELSQRLVTARGVVEAYQKTIVPTRERIVALSQQQYDAMLLGVFQLLIAKQNEIASYRDFIDALRDYWSLRAELEWKVGGSLGAEPASSPPPVQSKPSQGVEKHDHHAP